MCLKTIQILLPCLFLLIGCGKNNINTIHGLEGTYCGYYTSFIKLQGANGTKWDGAILEATIMAADENSEAFTMDNGPLRAVPIAVNGTKLEFDFEKTTNESPQGQPSTHTFHHHYTGSGEIVDEQQIELNYSVISRRSDSTNITTTTGSVSISLSETFNYTGSYVGKRTEIEIVEQRDGFYSMGSYITLNNDTINWSLIAAHFSTSCNLTTPFTDSVSQQLQRHINVFPIGETFLLLFNDLANGSQSDTLRRVN